MKNDYRWSTKDAALMARVTVTSIRTWRVRHVGLVSNPSGRWGSYSLQEIGTFAIMGTASDCGIPLKHAAQTAGKAGSLIAQFAMSVRTFPRYSLGGRRYLITANRGVPREKLTPMSFLTESAERNHWPACARAARSFHLTDLHAIAEQIAACWANGSVAPPGGSR